MQTVYKSSEECNKINAANKDAIEAGLIEAVQPDAHTLEREKYQVQQAVITVERKAAREEIIKQVTGEVVECNCASTRIAGVAIEFSEQSVGWRMSMESGDYKNRERTWLLLSNLEITDLATLNKAKEKFGKCKKHADYIAKCASDSTKAHKRLESFVAAQPAFCERMEIRTYSSNVSVDDAGNVRIQYDTFTMAQWIAVKDLQEKQASDMKLLKDSFKAKE